MLLEGLVWGRLRRQSDVRGLGSGSCGAPLLLYRDPDEPLVARRLPDDPLASL